MSRGKPIGLTGRQLALVMAGAEQLRGGEVRSRFLSTIADELTDREITDAAVAAAVSRALERFAHA
jgi:hypothetical protein